MTYCSKCHQGSQSETLSSLYLLTGQAAKLLRVNRLSVQRWVNIGVLHGERVGNVTLIPRVEVEALARERETLYG